MIFLIRQVSPFTPIFRRSTIFTTRPKISMITMTETLPIRHGEPCSSCRDSSHLPSTTELFSMLLYGQKAKKRAQRRSSSATGSSSPKPSWSSASSTISDSCSPQRSTPKLIKETYPGSTTTLSGAKASRSQASTQTPDTPETTISKKTEQ